MEAEDTEEAKEEGGGGSAGGVGRGDLGAGISPLYRMEGKMAIESSRD